jgi:acyl CoA:acetate/3-ketoacid CoA transferase alpha subunit
VVQHGYPVRYNVDGSVSEYSQPKETRSFHGKQYMLEESIVGDYALIKAWKGDTDGNLVFRGTARAFNVECAK